MSVTLDDIGNVADFKEICNYLFENDESKPSSLFDTAEYSLSGSGNVLSFLYNNRLVITKLVESAQHTEFSITHKGVVADINSESATCILSLSVALQQKSVGATTLIKTSTWDCVAVGFTSGYFRLYTESGIQLFEQIFHPQGIKSMKYCQPKPLQDELLIIYSDLLIAVDGFSLYQCLRFCRLQQQRTTANNSSKNISISYKKWLLQDQHVTRDVEFYGIRNTTPFEHLFQASLAGGSAHYVGQAGLGPVYNYVAVGKGPFIAQYCPSEQVAQPIMSEVVMSVASKLISYIPGSSWLTGWAQTSKEEQIKFDPAIAISKNICIDDTRREIVSIKASPRGNLAILSDTFGRLLLLDVSSMILVNIWKGYREAQCGWIVVPDLTSSAEKPQNTLFLIIYAKKRGILEIWCPHQHYRVAAFNIGKRSALISSMFGALGEGSLSTPLEVPGWRGHKSCCFLLQEDGKLVNIQVPFQSCFGLEYLLSLEDLKLVDRALSICKSDNISKEDGSEIEKIILEVKLASNISRILDSILVNSNLTLEFKKNTCWLIMKDIASCKDLSSQQEFITLYQSCKIFFKLSDLHESITEKWKAVKFLSSSTKSSLLYDLKSIIEQYFSKSNQPLTFDFPNMADFQNSFVCNKSITSIDQEPILSLNVPPEKEEIFSRFLTLHFLHSEEWEVLLDQLLQSSLDLVSVLKMFIKSCLSLDIQICSLEYQTKICEVCKSILLRFESPSEFWDTFFNVLKSEINVCQGLVLAIYCQTIAVDDLEFTTTTIEKDEDEDVQMEVAGSECGSVEEQEWVALSPEHERWYTTRQQLSDVLHLQNNTGVKCSVDSLLSSNTHTVTHIVANYIIENNLVQNIIDWIERCRNFVTDDDEGSEEQDEVFDDNLNWLLNIIMWWPYQLDPTAISVCLVECLIYKWSEELESVDPDISVKHLTSASKILLCVKSVSVQQALFNVLWETVFSVKLKKIYSLIEKIGRQPKDRVCVKDLSMTLDSLISFVSIARHIIVNINISSGSDDSKLVLKQENVWACDQRTWLLHKIVNYDMVINPDFVIVHAQLITVLELIISFNIKNIRPSILFHSRLCSHFFTPLTTRTALKSWSNPDIDGLREQMLKVCVKSAVCSDLDVVPYQTSWTMLIVNISTLWELAVPIQSHMAVLLYSLGKFEDAEEIVVTSSHRQDLGIQLLNVLLSLLEIQIFKDEESQKLYLPVVSPTLSSWLRSKRDPNVAVVDIRIVFKTFSNVITWIAGNDQVVVNSRELRSSLLKVLG